MEQPPSSSGRVGGRSTDPPVDCRQLIADLLDVPDARRIVFATSATHALNLAIHGLALRSRAVVITTVTEHNSVLRPLFLMERSMRARIITIGLDATGCLDSAAFEAALAEHPTLVAINHASNVTGRINDVERFFAMAKAAGATTLLDASQTVGHVPVRPLDCGADLVAFPGHKGLHGPAGTGALYVASHVDLEQIVVGGTGFRSESRSHPADMPHRLEAGTPNGPCLAGLGTALVWHREHGAEYRQRSRHAGNRLHERLRSIAGIRLLDDVPEPHRLGIVSFRIAGWEVAEIGLVLRESFDIMCRAGLHCAPLMHAAIGSSQQGTVRLSTSGFNTDAEIDAAVAAVALLASK